MGLQRVWHDWATELNWTQIWVWWASWICELIFIINFRKMSAIFSLLPQVLDHALFSFMSPMLFFPILFFFFFLPSVSVWIISIFGLSNLPLKVNVLVTQYCSAFCDPMDCSLPCSSVCVYPVPKTIWVGTGIGSQRIWSWISRRNCGGWEVW